MWPINDDQVGGHRRNPKEAERPCYAVGSESSALDSLAGAAQKHKGPWLCIALLMSVRSTGDPSSSSHIHCPSHPLLARSQTGGRLAGHQHCRRTLRGSSEAYGCPACCTPAAHIRLHCACDDKAPFTASASSPFFFPFLLLS